MKINCLSAGLLAFSCIFSSIVSLAAESWRIETYAGTGVQGFSGDGGPATGAQLNNPFGVIRGPDGCIWFCEYTGQRVRRVRQDGTIETIAGTGEKGYSGDGGPALKATFNLPHEIRFDQAGDLYVVDMSNHAVRKIDMKTKIISTIAGTGEAGYSGDGGPAKQAQLAMPHSIQFGPDGNLYICDIKNHVIRRIDMKTQIISTFAGTGKAGETPDGSPLQGTPLKGPRSLDFDHHGNLWLATREGNQVFKFDLKAGIIHHVAGTGKSGFTGNGGPAKEATLKGPKGIAIDREGNVWLADTESHSVRRIHAKSGIIELMAGTGEKGDGPDGDPLQCKLARLHGIFADADGSIFIGDSETHRVRVMRRERIVHVAGASETVAASSQDQLLYEPFGAEFDRSGTMWITEMIKGNRLLRRDRDGKLVHVAGQKNPGSSGDGGPALAAQFQGPHNIAVRPDGRILIADTWNGKIRQVDPRAGTVESLPQYVVPSGEAKKNGPYCINLDFTGSKLYIADLRRIHRLDLETGKLEVFAGNGEKGRPRDGHTAIDEPLVDPRAVAADRLGNVYILERGGNALRVVDPQGIIRTVVNADGKKGNEGDGGMGIDAKLNGPKYICIDPQDRVLIADAENHLVRRYDPSTQRIERIAGTGTSGRSGVGGNPLECQLARPHGISVHPLTGEIYITDSYNDRVLKIESHSIESQ